MVKSRGFRQENGSWVYAAEGGVVQLTIDHAAVPADDPAIEKLSAVYNIPAEQIRAAFGELPATNAVEVAVETPVEAPETPAVEAVAESVDTPVEEEAKPKKSKKAKKAAE